MARSSNEKAVIEQRLYCMRNKVPQFAPENGICYRCKQDIYGPGGYTADKAGKILITGCPLCGRTFCD